MTRMTSFDKNFTCLPSYIKHDVSPLFDLCFDHHVIDNPLKNAIDITMRYLFFFSLWIYATGKK